MKFLKPVLVALMILLTSPTLAAGKEYFLNLEYLDMQWQKFKDQRDPYVPEYNDDWAYRVSTNFRFAAFNVLYWDNNLHMEALDSGTPKTTGWHWTIGLRVTKILDIFAEHHSRHVMEDARAKINGQNQFPVEDSYGVRLIIFDNQPNRKSLSSLFGK